MFLRLFPRSLRFSLAFAGIVAFGGFLPAAEEAADGHRFFETEVRPILMGRCYECHSEEAGNRKGGLWLDRRAGWQTGGDSGPALTPGVPGESLLLHAIRYRDEHLQMPPDSRLPASEIAILERWIASGAPDPRDAALAKAVAEGTGSLEDARKSWAFRSHRNPPPPPVRDASWPRTPIDHFVLGALEAEGLAPTRDAPPHKLLRRLHYDLTGLPPTPAEVAAFLRDPSPAAYEAVVDDLLSRPAFGETWGRHWLDVVRYADSNGGDRNFTFYQAWRYRNSVIDSLNADRSYYDFLREQIAGDLLPWETEAQRRRQLIASTFLSLGPKMLTERDKEKLRLDTADEQVDTLGRAFLGLTLGCARCHDHKFDPISQEDYYALAGIFRSTQVVMGTRNGCVNVASWVEQPLPLPDPAGRKLEAKVERLELAMRLTVEKSYQKKAGGKMTPDGLPFAGVIYDDSEAQLVGDWTPSTSSANRFGPGYVHDDRSGKGTKRAIFRASVPANGAYEVRVAYNASSNRAAHVPVTVEAWDRVERLTLDQTDKPGVAGLFEPIGRFRFEKGGRANVILETAGSGDGYVIVDAVQFIAVEDLARERRDLARAKEEGAGDPLHRMNVSQLKKELSRMIGELRDAELAMAPRDARDPGDIHLRIRGEPGQLGELIPRNFPRVLHDGPPPAIPDGESGRRQLAAWLTSPDNALVDRVFVNRVWNHLFGRGIVATVDNFGALGSGPSHPELLDVLATEFRAGGGSLKDLIRTLVRSRTYRLAAADPENALFGRHERRRLTAEEIRDSLLALSGALDRTPGTSTATAHGEDLDDPFSLAGSSLRTVYLPVARNNQVAELAVFDAANPDLVTGDRPVTTVPTQALYLLNDEFLLDRARAIGANAFDDRPVPRETVTALYQRILSRAPRPAEQARALAFLEEASRVLPDGSSRAEAYGHLAHLLLASTEFLYLD